MVRNITHAHHHSLVHVIHTGSVYWLRFKEIVRQKGDTRIQLLPTPRSLLVSVRDDTFKILDDQFHVSVWILGGKSVEVMTSAATNVNERACGTGK